MKRYFLLLVLGLISLHAGAQGNKKPKIIGQEPIVTNEEESVTILMSHLHVQDADDWFYPWGFTMQVYPGANYSLQGNVLIPATDFFGTLVVQVTVHDGSDASNKFDLNITVNPVNDKPVITGQSALSTDENKPVAITTGDITVSDPDNSYPGDFTLNIHAGSNYTVSGNQVTPNPGFAGSLSVNVSVHDGMIESDIFGLVINVKAVNHVPEITGQATLQVNEDESLTIALTKLTVVDDDSNYPTGFTLSVASGDNYTVSGATVTPVADYFGRLTVPVTVNDGKNSSSPFNLMVTVTPVDDIPVIVDMETVPLLYGTDDMPIPISETLVVSEVDGDSIMVAEVGFNANGYQATVDKLTYTPVDGSAIRAVFDPGTGVLTLLGQGSPARYTHALRSVRYERLPAGDGVPKMLYVKVNDGKSDSEMVQRSVQFGQAAVALDIPTAFTPNGDLSNDTWKIIPLKSEEVFEQAQVKIYNKTGVLVYEAIGFSQEWDGRLNGELLPADIYFYTIDFKTDTPEGFVKGIVTILR